MNKKILESIINRVGTPFFLYEYEKIKQQYNKLFNALPFSSKIYYSVKANPSLAICQVMKTFTEYAEVSSLQEILCAQKCGFENRNILFSGPGKTTEELEYAIKHNITINVESKGEVLSIHEICSEMGIASNILIRINPGFSNPKYGITMSGVASQFGVDISDVGNLIQIIQTKTKINIKGFSVYLGSQILDANVIIDNTKKILELFIELINEYRIDVQSLNFGGGFGISYFDNKELDYSLLKSGLNDLFKKYNGALQEVNIFFESGRFLLAESGSFITKVLYIKKSKGKEYLICDGGFNNILISSFFTRELRGNFPIEVCNYHNEPEQKEYTICGPLCSPNDKFGCNILLPVVNEGDIIMVKKVGAYGLTYSPVLFISHIVPAEILIRDDQYYVIRSSSNHEYYFDNQYMLPQEVLNKC